MRVVLIAHTVFTDAAALNSDWADSLDRENDTDADLLAEGSGRSCYQSWAKPNPVTATNAGYLNNIIARRHFSVLEHASLTFYISGVSRSFTHELVRHRHLSFSQLSQRYVDEGEAEIILPPNTSPREEAILRRARKDALAAYHDLLTSRMERGFKRKEARQSARAALPNATETRIVVTGNIRSWREVIEKRHTPDADAEFYLVAGEILQVLREKAPNSVADIKEETHVL